MNQRNEIKRRVTYFCMLSFEPTANIENFNIITNVKDLPNISQLKMLIFKYLLFKPDYKDLFIKNSFIEDLLPNLFTMFPNEILNNIAIYSMEIKGNIYHLIYNYWYSNYINIIENIKNDVYEVYILSDLNLHQIHNSLTQTEILIHDIFSEILSSLNVYLTSSRKNLSRNHRYNSAYHLRLLNN